MPQSTPDISSLEQTISTFFAQQNNHAEQQNSRTEQPYTEQSSFLQAINNIYNQNINNEICCFLLDDNSSANAINQLKDRLKAQNPDFLQKINNPLTYLLDELICNIQQHAQTDKGYAFINHNALTNNIEILIADAGITIYGSYVAAQKHLDKLGNSDAEALNLAQNGYSVKNLPDTENRGYGISSNIRMVVDGLQGEFAILSGNALMLHSSKNRKILALPEAFDYKGTMVMVSFPAQIPTSFNFYDYIS